MATHSSILAWENRMDRGAWWAAVRGVAKSWHDRGTKHSHIYMQLKKKRFSISTILILFLKILFYFIFKIFMYLIAPGINFGMRDLVP